MKELLKKIGHRLLGDYSAYFIYEREVPSPESIVEVPATHEVVLVDSTAIAASADPLMQEQAGYAGPGAYAYACLEGSRIVGLCFYWFGDRYLQRNFWPLKTKEAKLVQIITLPEMRGRGVAGALISFSFRDMAQKNFSRLYARIWHSNTPSLHAFERAGWVRIALVIEINPFRRQRPHRLYWRMGGRQAAT